MHSDISQSSCREWRIPNLVSSLQDPETKDTDSRTYNAASGEGRGGAGGEQLCQ